MERDNTDSSIFMNDGFRNSKGYLNKQVELNKRT